MEKLLFSFITAMFLVVPAVCGANSFRLENGQLLQNGMTKDEVVAKAGKPKRKETLRKTRGAKGKKEVWTYYVNNTFGSPAVVTVTFQGNEVIKVGAKQK